MAPKGKEKLNLQTWNEDTLPPQSLFAYIQNRTNKAEAGNFFWKIVAKKPQTLPVSDFQTVCSRVIYSTQNLNKLILKVLVCHTRVILAPSISHTFSLIVQVFGSEAPLFRTCHLIFRVTAATLKVLHPELHVGNSFWQATQR